MNKRHCCYDLHILKRKIIGKAVGMIVAILCLPWMPNVKGLTNCPGCSFPSFFRFYNYVNLLLCDLYLKVKREDIA